MNGLNAVAIDLVPFEFGTAPFKFNWEGPNNSKFSSEDLTSVDPGEYFVTVTDDLGCVVESSIVVPACCEMNVVCQNDTLYFDCLSEVPSVNPKFIDAVSLDSEDEILINDLNMNLTGSCNPIYVNVNDESNAPQNCIDENLIITRSYEIHDGVTVVSCHQTYIIDNYKGIEILQEAQDLTVSCSEDISGILDNWIATNGGLEFQECSSEFEINIYPPITDFSYICEGSGSIDITFEIIDDCENIATSQATFRVEDNEAPSIDCPENLFLLFEEFDPSNLPTSWLNTLVSEDNCSQTSTSFTVSNLGTFEDCQATIVSVEFYAVDDCGNTSFCESLIEIGSSIVPSINCPEEVVIPCDEVSDQLFINNWLESVSISGTTDDTVNPESDFNLDNLLQLVCDESIIVNFFMDDVCGQNIKCSSSITVVDEVAPNILCPENVTLDFNYPSFEIDLDFWLDNVEGQDNCSSVKLSNYYSPDFSNLVCEQSETIEFVATDACDNSSNCFSTLTVFKNYVPVLESAQPITLSLGEEDLEYLILDHLNSTSVYSELEYELVNDFDFQDINLDNEEVDSLIVNFIATDICNNIAEGFTVIHLIPIPKVYIPNVFTPDSDNLNDAFTAYANIAVVEISAMIIFDRWGNKVFEKYNFLPNDMSEGWDGTHLNDLALPDVYTYYITVQDMMKEESEYAGTVQLLK